jgi:hypothetical protein
MNGNSCHKSWITVGGLRAIKCLLTKCRAKAEDRRLGDNRWLGKKGWRGGDEETFNDLA